MDKDNETKNCSECGGTMHKKGNQWVCEKCGHIMEADENK